MLNLKSLIVTLIALVVQNEAARILAVFPVPSVSHQVVFRPLTQELAKRGHEVVVITTDPVFEKGKTPANFTEIDLHDMSYGVWKKAVLSGEVTKGEKNDLLNQHILSSSVVTNLFLEQLKTPEVQAILNNKKNKFDLIFVEAYIKMTLSIAHLFDANVIQINAFGAFPHNLVTHGMPMHPLVHPTSARQRVLKLSLWEKLTELYHFYQLEQIYAKSEEYAEKQLRGIIGNDMPTLNELTDKVDMLFLNVHPIWEMNRPSPPNVVYLGGLHQQPVKDLPKDLQKYLDSSKNGVIYISFGTNVDPAMLPAERLTRLVKVFSKLPYDVLWKWNSDELPGKSENIKISKWLPQSDLLRHPKVKLFITQGGLQSTDEAITAGVPLIGVPMLGDQWFNVEQYVYHKIGLRLDLEDITEENFEKAILTIVNDESNYRKNVANLRSVMRDQPQTPLERAVWWTEYVLRHGGAKHLRSPAANMPWTRYLELELVAYILGAVLLTVLTLIYAVYSLWTYVRPNTHVKLKKR